MYVDQHRRARLSFIPRDGVVQCVFGDGLESLVDAQLDIVRRNRRDLRQILDHVTVAIFPDPPHARFTGQLRVETLFYAFNPLPVDVSESEQIGRHMPGGIKTARFVA
ncbi:hypothetical protein D3C81_1660670 [compost metagenome]